VTHGGVPTEPSPRYPWLATAVPLRHLARGGSRWDVYLQVEPHPDVGAIRGRLHFLAADRHHATAWIFLEWTEKEVVDRARRFSAGELWSFLDALTAA
jgi:hypothetical protein